MRARLSSVLVSAVSSLSLACSNSDAITGMPDGPSEPVRTVVEVVVNPTSTDLPEGTRFTFSATPYDQYGRPATDIPVDWSSSDISVATVSAVGEVATLREGSVTITAASAGVTGEATLRVVRPPSGGIVISPSAVSLKAGQSVGLTAVVVNSAGDTLTGRTIAWATSDSAVAQVTDAGLLTAVAEGAATISASSEGERAEVSVVVTPNPAPVSRVIITPSTARMAAGESVQLTAMPADSTGTALNGRIVAWMTSDSAVARVSSTGLVSGVAPGTASITATSEGVSQRATVTVTPVPVASVSVTPPNPSVVAHSTVQLTATPRDSAGNPLTGRQVTWTSSTTTVATISTTGLVTGVSAGTATLTARIEGKSGSVTITVTPAPVAIVVITPAPASVALGSSVQLTATPKDASDNALTGRAITWTSSDPSKASVSTRGLVTAHAVGTTTISAATEGKTGTAIVMITGSGVAVNLGDDLQAAVNAHPAGTTFLIKAGRHRRQSVVPKTGNSFIGEPGAILDGENVTDHAFEKGRAPYPSNVRIQGLVIERYRPEAQMGAVLGGGHNRDDGTVGWVIEGCEIRYNAAGGIRLGHKMKVLRNYLHHNEQIGMSGIGDSILAEGNEIAYNNPNDAFVVGHVAGGTKFAGTRWLVVRNNFSHHNHGPGLWTDIDNIYSLIEGNRVEDNTHQGIFHEISYDAVIRNNIVKRNGHSRAGDWLYGAGILIGHSRNVEVYGNIVEGNANGITGIQQDRGSGRYGPHLLQNLYVHDNTITMTRGVTGVGEGGSDTAAFTSRNNRFQNNTYHLGASSRYFTWMHGPRTEAQWRDYGQDVSGSFNR